MVVRRPAELKARCGTASSAVACVRFASERPALFRVMFAEACDPAEAERTAAAAVMRDYVGADQNR